MTTWNRIASIGFIYKAAACDTVNTTDVTTIEPATPTIAANRRKNNPLNHNSSINPFAKEKRSAHGKRARDLLGVNQLEALADMGYYLG
jgi:hypothetical protein